MLQWFGQFFYGTKPQQYILLFGVSLSYFTVSMFSSNALKKKKKQMCMLLKKVDDERTFCAKCLQAFIILYGSQSDLMSRTRKVKDTNLLKIHQHLLSNTMPEDNGLK